MAFLLVVLVAAVSALSVSLARPAQALGLSAVSVSPNTMGATAQISFQVSNQSANTAEEIRVDFLANTFGVPQTIPATAVTVTGETVQSVATTGGTRVTIILVAPGIPQGGTATVTFTPAAGITNPTVPGNYSLSVSTEEEVTPLGSAAFSIVGQIQLLTMTLTPSTAGAMDVTALLTFRVAQNTASGAAVSIGFPAEPNAAAPNEFTVPTTITAAQVQVRAGATAAEAANAQPLSPGGVAVTDGDNLVTVTIILPSGLDQDGTPNLVETGRFIAVRFLPAAGIDSPTSPGTSPLTVSTSVDTAPATSSVTLGAQAPSAQADLSVTMSEAPDPLTAGNKLIYVVIVTNNGPAPATGVSLTDTLPDGVTLISAIPSQGRCQRNGNTVTCFLGALAKDASGAVAIVVTPTSAGTVTNTARVTANELDTNPANNTATASTTVSAQVQVAAAAMVGETEFTGIVQRIPGPNGCRLQGISEGDTWLIQGLQVQVLQGVTEIEGRVTCGSFVEVEGALTPGGEVNAEEIEVESRGRGKGHRGKGGDRPGSGLGDSNHKHQGPPGLSNKDGSEKGHRGKGGDRPGSGLGDSNHKHQGPPGLSDKDGSEKGPRDSVQTPQKRKDSRSERVKGSDDNHRPGKGSVGKGNGKGKGQGKGKHSED
jgi:uncharacterized repeat protein (TIGR01451 family)